MKMYKKSKLSYENGYIVKNDKIVGIDNEVVDLLNRIEHDYQVARWRKNHPAIPATEVPPFEFETDRGEVFVSFESDTPALDEALALSMAIMDDLDAVSTAEQLNHYFEGIQPVINFVNDERVVSFNQNTQHRFDLKYLGNPLELTKEKLVELISEMFVD